MVYWKMVVCALGIAINIPLTQESTQAADLAYAGGAFSVQPLFGTLDVERFHEANDIATSANPAGISSNRDPKSRADSALRNMGPKEVLEEYVLRLAEHEFEAVEPLISEAAVFWFNDGSHVGIPAIRTAFEKNFAAFPLERYWVSEVRWVATGPKSATCIYRFHWTAQTPEGEVGGGGRGTTAVRLEEDGWKIVHLHLSQEPAPG